MPRRKQKPHMMKIDQDTYEKLLATDPTGNKRPFGWGRQCLRERLDQVIAAGSVTAPVIPETPTVGYQFDSEPSPEDLMDDYEYMEVAQRTDAPLALGDPARKTPDVPPTTNSRSSHDRVEAARGAFHNERIKRNRDVGVYTHHVPVSEEYSKGPRAGNWTIPENEYDFFNSKLSQGYEVLLIFVDADGRPCYKSFWEGIREWAIRKNGQGRFGNVFYIIPVADLCKNHQGVVLCVSRV